MPSSLDDIEKQLTSSDLIVLRQSLELAEKCLAREGERRDRGENRATAMLATLGVIAGLIVPQANTVAASGLAVDERWFLFVCFVGCVLFLVRGLVYAMKVIIVAKQYQIEPESAVYELQKLRPVEAIRKEVAAVLWTYCRAVQPTTEKLFWLHRCQRNSVVAVILLVLFGLTVFVIRDQWFELPSCASMVAGVVGAILFLAIDPIAERYSRVWNP